MGQTCCESKQNLHNISLNNQKNQSKNYQYNTQQIPPDNNQLYQPKPREYLNTKIEEENLETAQDEINRDIQIEETKLDQSNEAPHVSLGSSIRFSDSQDMDQNSIIKPNKGNNNLNNNLNENNGVLNLYEEANLNNDNNNSKYVNENTYDNLLPLKCIESFEAHQEKIVSLIELNNGKIATGSYDSTIKIWNLNNLECEKTINEGGYVLCLLEFEDNMLLSGTINIP